MKVLKMELVRINELDSNYINKIFDEIKTKINLEWFNDSLIAAMKIEYYYNHAFTKYISLLLSKNTFCYALMFFISKYFNTLKFI